jgi:two-component system, NarL family, nitrate/nitrite response regulator NarL
MIRSSQNKKWHSCSPTALPNRQIAHRLKIGEHTVSNYLFRIYNKLGVSSRVELVLYLLKEKQTN